MVDTAGEESGNFYDPYAAFDNDARIQSDHSGSYSDEDGYKEMSGTSQ